MSIKTIIKLYENKNYDGNKIYIYIYIYKERRVEVSL